MHIYLQRSIAAGLSGMMAFMVLHGYHDIYVDKTDEFKTIDIELVGNTYNVNYDTADLNCMAINMYFEARNQDTDEAMAAVGYTVLNRVVSERYPDTVCNVVYQARRDSAGNPIRNKCQFSWACDGLPDRVNMDNVLERQAWERANRIAQEVLEGKIDNPVGNATMYHATYVRPYWRTAYTQVAKVETHIFYSAKSRG